MSDFLPRIKSFVTSRSLLNFFIGGQNFGAGISTFANAIYNYLAFRAYPQSPILAGSTLLLIISAFLPAALSLRLVGVIVIQVTVGASIAVLELFPQPDLLDRHANFLNTYFGRCALYLVIVLISADNIEIKSEHKWAMYMTWLSAGSLAVTSAFFFGMGMYSMLVKPLPVSRSMTTTVEAGKYNASKSSTDGLDRSKSMKDSAAGGKNGRGGKKVGRMTDIETQYGDPFDQVALGRSGWTETALTNHDPKVPLSSVKIKPDWSDYSIDMSTSSYAHQVATTDSRLQWSKSEISPTTPDEDYQRAKQKAGKRLSSKACMRMKYNKEASSSQDQLILSPALDTQSPKRGSRVTFESHSGLRNEVLEKVEWTPFSTSHDDDDDEQEGHKSRRQASQRAKRRSSHHKRVFVPGIGSFDLSSGSDESEGEREQGVAQGTAQQINGDNDSVYSVDSDVENSQTREGGDPARLGRKLTRKETRTYRGKLNRGMQRAMSQRQGQQHSVGDKSDLI